MEFNFKNADNYSNIITHQLQNHHWFEYGGTLFDQAFPEVLLLSMLHSLDALRHCSFLAESQS